MSDASGKATSDKRDARSAGNAIRANARQGRSVSTAGHRSVAEGVRETIESIVVAFILAFVFRAFVVEAFVIPTGSMAATLYGEQATTTCSTCGYEYARGVSHYRGGPVPISGYDRLRCPNCDTEFDRIPPLLLQRPDSGDRILVQKWPWTLGLDGNHFIPQRWDVTVFKDPSDGTTNFIKRLVGLPGEVLEIIDGDIYTVPLSTLKEKEPGLIEDLDTLRREVYAHREAGSPVHHEALIARSFELNKRVVTHLKIARKTELAQEALWVNVFNNDFKPATGPSRPVAAMVGWRPVDGESAQAWDVSGRELACRSQSEKPLAIRFEGKRITDFVAYNYGEGTRESPDLSCNPVGDVRLHFTWFPDAGDGGITLQMNHDQDVFTANLGVDGTAGLEHRRSSSMGLRPARSQAKFSDRPLNAGRAVEIDLANVDYRVSLKVDGRELLHTTDQDYQPDMARVLQISQRSGEAVKPTEIQIACRRLYCRLRHVVIERDVYYRNPTLGSEPNKPVNPYNTWPGWGTTGHPIMLRTAREVAGKQYAGEYFMLGDNSPFSKDSRLWWEIGPHLKYMGDEYQIGTVPGDQLIGKAFFVYWPAGYKTSWSAGIGLIPNFGRMRWIR